MAAVRLMIVAFLIVLVSAKPSVADRAEVYDLDSRAWMASDIIEAEVIQMSEEILEVSTVKVTAVHEGNLQVGQTVPIHLLSIYRKTGEMRFETEPLESGDRLFLFLESAEPAPGFTPAGPKAMSIVPSGIRLIRYGHVIPFRQLRNPGPIAAPTPSKDEASQYVSLEEFRDRVAEAMATAAKLNQFFAEPSSPEDVPELLDLLRKRIALPHQRGQDKAAEEVCVRLANMHHIEGLNTALFLDLPSWECDNAIESGFSFPRGRDFLLARIGDDMVPLEHRIRYARILRGAGREYYSTYRDITTHSASIVGRDHKDNGGYLTRVAKLTADVMEHEKLCLAMLDAMGRFASSLPGRPNDDPIRVDLRGALPALVELHRNTKSARVRFHVENVIALISRSKYRSLGPNQGPILSLVQHATHKSYSKPKSDEFDFRYQFIALDGSSGADAELVFAHKKSDREFTIPFEIRHRGRRVHQGGYRRVTLPENLPPGRYRVFLRFTRDGKVISEGYGFEIEF